MTTQAIQLPQGMSVYESVAVAMQRLYKLEEYLKEKDCTYLKFSAAPMGEKVVMEHDGVNKFRRNNAGRLWIYEVQAIPVDAYFAMVDYLAAQHGWTKHTEIFPHYVRVYSR
jgi:hypothetical protein